MNYKGCRAGDSAGNRPKSVLLADGHEIFRAGLRSYLNTEMAWLKVIAEAGDCREALERIQETAPEIIILDSELPALGGLEATRRLSAVAKCGILILCGKFDIQLAREAIRAGARGIVLKSSPVNELTQALQAVAVGEVFFGGAILESLRTSGPSSNRDIKTECSVTAREREVLQLLSEGHTTKEMAQRLDISVRTVETHRSQIMNKLNIHSTAELTKYAIRHGLTHL